MLCIRGHSQQAAQAVKSQKWRLGYNGLEQHGSAAHPAFKLLKSADVTMVDISFTNEGGVVLLPY